MMMAVFGGRVLETRSFTSNTTWVAPITTARLETLDGRGQDGRSPSGAHSYVNYYDYYTQRTYQRDDGSTFSDAEVYQGRFAGWSHPANHCNAPSPVTGVPGIAYTVDCFRYVDITVDEGNYVPGTTGTDATGFGKTFAGGVGGPATVASYPATAVTPGSSNNLVIPSGAVISFTYYR